MLEIFNLRYTTASTKNKYLKKPWIFELFIPNLEIKTGEILGIYGRNGSGKTTLVECLVGAKNFQEGLIKVKNKEPVFSAVFQDSQFDDWPIIKILAFLNQANGNVADFEKLLIDFELSESIKKKFSELSFGQKQRFRLIVSLLKPFSILILDEITTGIDQKWKKIIYNLLQNIISLKKTIIMISHDENEMIRFCDRVVYLEKGKVVDIFQLQGTLEEKQTIFEEKVEYLTEDNGGQEWEIID